MIVNMTGTLPRRQGDADPVSWRRWPNWRADVVGPCVTFWDGPCPPRARQAYTLWKSDEFAYCGMAFTDANEASNPQAEGLGSAAYHS